MRYAQTFHIPPQQVESDTVVLWWERWLLFEQATRSAEALQHRDAYAPCDEDGNPNWAAWAEKHPELDRAANWALIPDRDSNDNPD